jgi:membrane protease YdiL (CAAX protease family)
MSEVIPPPPHREAGVNAAQVQDGQATSPPATWKAIEAFPVYGIAVLGAFILGLPLLLITQSSGWFFVVALVAGQVALAGSVLTWVRFVNRGPLAALGRFRLGDVGLGVVGGLALYLVSLLWGALVLMLTSLLGHDLSTPEQIPDAVRGSSVVVAAVATVLGAPVSEELFFRGFLYKGLRRRFRPWPAALISSLPFALVHGAYGSLSQGAILVIALFPVGVGLAFVYEHRQSLMAAITAHALFNAVGFTLIMLGR